jgi:pimeloyl-ACP methyl ester carboxylesterase
MSEVALIVRTRPTSAKAAVSFYRAGAGRMMTVESNGVTLGVEHFGDASAPLVLLAGGTTMLSWPDALCEALARGRRHVVRYDLRDCGVSTTVSPTAPAYTLRDLAADAASLARKLDDRPAHLAGIGVGGMVTQVAALDHPDMFSALTLVGTRPVAPGPVDEDLPEHDATMMDRLFSRPMPDWSDRAPSRSTPPPARRSSATTPPPHTRVPSASGIARRAQSPRSRWPTKWAWCSPSSTARRAGANAYPSSAIPVLVVHGQQDPFFPVGNGEVLAREIPGAKLLVLQQAATAIPVAAADEIAAAMLEL